MKRRTLQLLLLPAIVTLPRTAAAQTPEPATSTTTVLPSLSRVRLALQTEPAFGVSGGSFYNQLAGGRIDYRFTGELALGSYLGYANLAGQAGRAHDVIAYLQLEYRPRIAAGSAFGLPLRFATGYLPYNGPLMRVSTGVSYAASPQLDVVFDVLAPTVWIIRDRTVVSLGGALELSYSL